MGSGFIYCAARHCAIRYVIFGVLDVNFIWLYMALSGPSNPHGYGLPALYGFI